MSENMTCEQILRDLTYCDNEFPDAAIQAARSKRDELIPGLIETIRNATEKSNDGGVVCSMGHIMAMFLLKEFNAKNGFPAILESMSSKDADDLYGDFITEDLQYVTSSLADDPEQFAEVIDDPDVYEYVRGALVGAVFGMVCEERISREHAIQFLRDRLATAIEDDDSHIVTKCVEMLGQLLAEEASVDVKAAEEAELVDETWIGDHFFDDALAKGQSEFDEAKRLYLDGAKRASIDKMKTMPWFRTEQVESKSLEGVIDEISKPFWKLPADAVRWARKHPEEITPHLIRLIENVPKYAESRADDPESPEAHGHVIALYLLMEFGYREILPTLLSHLSNSDESIVECYNDVIDVDLSQILGRLADEQEQLRELISNPEVFDSVKRDAVDAIVWMVTENRLDRNRAIDVLHDWFQESRKAANPILSTWIALALLDLGASALRSTLIDACNDGELEEMWICTEEIDEALSQGNNSFSETINSHRKNRIEHSVVELSEWDWDGSRRDDEDDLDDDDDSDDDLIFAGDNHRLYGGDDLRKMWMSMRERMSPEQMLEFVQSGLSLSDSEVEVDREDSRLATTTIRNEAAKVGRNDPCPCGSGRKYKKCCAKGDV